MAELCRAGGDPGDALDLDPVGPRRPAWMAAAACRAADLDVFFSEDPSLARVVCFRCGVRDECLAYALAARIPHGVFGGLNGRERGRLLRGQRYRQRPEPTPPTSPPAAAAEPPTPAVPAVEPLPRAAVQRQRKRLPGTPAVQRRRRNEGLCSSCGERPATSKGMCHACHQRWWWREQRAAAGRCDCGAAIDARSTRCRSCAGKAWRAARAQRAAT